MRGWETSTANLAVAGLCRQGRTLSRLEGRRGISANVAMVRGQGHGGRRGWGDALPTQQLLLFA